MTANETDQGGQQTDKINQISTQPPKPNRARLFVGLISIIVIIIAGVIFAANRSNNAKITPSEASSAFTKMINNSLSTSSLTQATTIKGDADSSAAGDSDTSLIHFDTSNLAKPHLDFNWNDKIGSQLSLNSNYVLDNGDGYAKLLSLGGSVGATLNNHNPPMSSYLNKWFPITQSGQPINGHPSQAVADIDTLNSEEWGTLVFANLTSSQREEALAYINSAKVYSYDPALVTKQSVAGQPYYVYEVKINNNALLKLNEQIMSYFNVQMTDTVQQGITSFKADKVEFWINPASDQLLRITAHLTGSSAETSTTNYSDYNKTAVAVVPKLQLTVPDAESIFGGFYTVNY